MKHRLTTKKNFALYARNFHFFPIMAINKNAMFIVRIFQNKKMMFTSKSLNYRATDVVQPSFIVHVKVCIPVTW